MRKTSLLSPLLLLVLCLSATPCAAQGDEVALMFPQRFNNGWNAANQNEALLLGSHAVLRDALQGSDIRLVNWTETTNLFNAAEAGFYLRSDQDDDFTHWQRLVEAYVYIEADLTRERMIWRALMADGQTQEKTVARPLENPSAVAAALVSLIYESTGQIMPESLQALMEIPETEHAPLFFEWAKWIGYSPHWTHHAPWDGPRESALRIIQRDPEFRRGMAWAVPTMRRRAQHHTTDPSAEEFFYHASLVLDSPFAGRVIPLYSEWLKNPALRRDAISQLGFLDVDLGSNGAGPLSDMSTLPGSGTTVLNRDLLPSGPLFRINMIGALATQQSQDVLEALVRVAQTDEDASVRAAAVSALQVFPKGASTRALEQALSTDAAGEVRAAAAAVLISRHELSDEAILELLQDSAPAVRAAAATNLSLEHHAPLQPSDRWQELLGDPDLPVRIASMKRLTETASPVAPAQRPRLEAILREGEAEEQLLLMQWLRAIESTPLNQTEVPHLLNLLDHQNPALRAGAARTLHHRAPEQASAAIARLSQDSAPAVRSAVVDLMLAADDGQYHQELLHLLPTLHQNLRQRALDTLYLSTRDDARARMSLMRHDPSMRVNFSAIDMALRDGESTFTDEFLFAIATEHDNEYVRSRALRELQARQSPRLVEACVLAIKSPFWILRLDGADILADIATPAQAEAIELALQQSQEKWLTLALQDALAQATGAPAPEKIRLNLGETAHMEGGHEPNGFQVWMGWIPKDREETRRLVDQGYRFGRKTLEPAMPGGANLSSFNHNRGMRNIYVQESVLRPLENWANELPELYYIALFDEPVSIGVGNNPDNVRAFLIETGKPELVAQIGQVSHEDLLAQLPRAYQEAFKYHWTRNAAHISNWVVRFFRSTAQRKYPDLRIFPQTLSYMWGQTLDAVDLIDNDGDYSWEYHNHQVIRDGALGAVHRVVNPGKPLLRITWMGWHRPNIIRGDSIYTDTVFPEGPWRFRNYMGFRSSLALWAGGAEAGFFNYIGLKPASDREAQGTARHPFQLKPWSEAALEAVDILMGDEPYWRTIDGQLAVQELSERESPPTIDLDGGDDLDDFDALLGGALDEGPTPLQAAQDKRRQELMEGISYMNIYNTDVTRALSNLPHPDTSRRSTLVVVGRDTSLTTDGSSFFTPSLAVVRGYDVVPNYDSILHADLMHYDTVILPPSADGVTPELVEAINDWLIQKQGGLLIVGGALSAENRLFPMLRGDSGKDTAFLWESSVRFREHARVKETFNDHRGRPQEHMTWPRLATFSDAGGQQHNDPLSRSRANFEGAVTELLSDADGRAVLARWNAPDEVSSTVLFDGGAGAGPVYTEALEAVILALDKERNSSVTRNEYWGHLIYENDAFVVDVASAHLAALVEARPRQLQGVDIITGVINPTVNRGEAALVLKDYVGPYAGGLGNWAVIARESLQSMTLQSPTQLEVEATGVTRVSHVGAASLRLESPSGMTEVADQIQVWEKMQKGEAAYSANQVEGGMELHFFSPRPVVLRAD